MRVDGVAQTNTRWCDGNHWENVGAHWVQVTNEWASQTVVSIAEPACVSCREWRPPTRDSSLAPYDPGVYFWTGVRLASRVDVPLPAHGVPVTRLDSILCHLQKNHAKRGLD